MEKLNWVLTPCSVHTQRAESSSSSSPPASERTNTNRSLNMKTEMCFKELEHWICLFYKIVKISVLESTLEKNCQWMESKVCIIMPNLVAVGVLNVHLNVKILKKMKENHSLLLTELYYVECLNLIGWRTFWGVLLFSGKRAANVVPGSSRPHYSSVSLRQMISVTSKGLTTAIQPKPTRHWPNT